MQHTTDIVIIGAGHAGVEAALAASRLGLSTVLFTLSLDAIANMPCNPSVGGTAKGHLVYEIDALGGEMGRAADAVTLQSRTLNTGKGAAVRSKRIQADRAAYRLYMKHTVERAPHLELIQNEVTELLTEPLPDGRRRLCGVVTRAGETYLCRAAVICAGTYLGGRIHMGEHSWASGPDGQLPASGLTASLAALGCSLRRFKTGTPQRIDRRTIDFSRLEIQEGEPDPAPFSALTDPAHFSGFTGIPCHIVYTTEKTHAVIQKNIGRSAMYSGRIHAVGPRYCPSIEDKIVRFADKERHQLFLEPTGAETNEMYLQGFSTSMPAEVQEEMVHTLPGFEEAHIMRYAYAIEYDCVDPLSLTPELEFKEIAGLYGAGQFNGTSGYEEAAAQGLVAGANAALRLLGRPALSLPRSSSYIGTLIDDLVTKGTNEPYRMMTSRSEYRLLLRQDNADLRLTPQGYDRGLVGEEQYRIFSDRRRAIEGEITRLSETTLPPSAEVNAMLSAHNSAPLTTGCRMAELLRRPELDLTALRSVDSAAPALSRGVLESVETAVKYEGYVRKQLDAAERAKKMEQMLIPDDIDYHAVSGLRLEAAEKLSRIRPRNIGQASRISGVNPADITVLLIRLKSGKE